MDKCADFVTYIANGRLVASEEKDDFLGEYRIVKGTKAQLTEDVRTALVGHKQTDFGFTGLMKVDNIPAAASLAVEPADIEDIMIYHERVDRATLER